MKLLSLTMMGYYIALLLACWLHGSEARVLRGLSSNAINRFFWYPSNAQSSFSWSTSGLSIARPILVIPWYSGSGNCITISQSPVSVFANSFCNHFGGKCEVYMLPLKNLGSSTVAQEVAKLQQCLNGVSGQPQVTGVMGDKEGIKVDITAYWTGARALNLETGFIKNNMAVTQNPSLDVNAGEFYGPVKNSCAAWGADPSCIPGLSNSACFSKNGATYGSEIANMMAFRDPGYSVTPFVGGCGSGGCGIPGQAADCALEYNALPAAVNAFFSSNTIQPGKDFGVYA